MTEKEIIYKRLARDGRTAYKKAKSLDNAFITIGNSIYRISADGAKCKVGDLSTTRVKAKQKKFEIK